VSVPTTIGFNHVATMTANMDRTVEFYEAAFGAEVTFEMARTDDHPRMTILDLGGGAALNVFEVDSEDEIVGERRRMGGRGAIDHYALAVDSLPTLEKVRDRLSELGSEIGGIQRLGAEWSLFFRDPDGMELEVCCKAE
jgi:catechol 2,3-dioxygenase-like lactoylglutathione lyase family enzyme